MQHETLPRLAIINSVLTPYGLHLHQRIARELPEVRLESLYMYHNGNQPWSFEAPPEINATWFEEPPGLTVAQRQQRRQIRSWSKAGAVIRWLREHRPAAVIVPGYMEIGRARIIAWCRAHGIPAYMISDSNVAGDRVSGWRRLVKQLYVQWIVRQVAGLIVFGRAGIEFYRRYGGDKKPCFLAPCDVDEGGIREITETQIDAAQRQFGLRTGRRHLVYCGRLASVKRVDLLLDAFASIADRRPEWDVLIVGDGPLQDDLRRRVPAHLAQRVVWTGFVGERTTIFSLYRAGNVFVLPSDFEPWGAVVAEACAAGLAIVSSDVVGAAVELVQDGVNGRQFRSGDVESLTAALLDVTERNHVQRMAEASAGVLAAWRDRHDPVAGVRKMLIHAGVLGKGDQPRS